MVRRLIADSCADFSIEKEKWTGVIKVPLILTLSEETYLDDKSFDRNMFLDKMRSTEDCPHSACPSPKTYMKEFEGADECFVVTLSGALSGSYQSALIAKNMYLEEHPEVKIEVIDSMSASVGESLIIMKLREWSDNYSFAEMVKRIRAFRDSLKTKFVLEDLEVFRKNGRLSGVQALLCNTLNIRPILGGKEGQIVKLDQARGVERALRKLVDLIVADVKEATMRTLAIGHCNHVARAESLKKMILERVPFRECMIVDTGGVSTMYANQGGVVLAY